MTRKIAVLLASTLLAGATALPLPPPLPPDPPGAFMWAMTGVPLPPPLPDDPPRDRAAPVPDADLQTPDQGGSEGAAFALHIYPMRQFSTSDAYPPGSAYESPEQRKPMQPPGFMVTVPLQ